MNYLAIVIVLVLALFSGINHAIVNTNYTLVDSVLTTITINNTEDGTALSMITAFNANQSDITKMGVDIIPCFGSFNVYRANNRIPTPTDNSASQDWDPMSLGVEWPPLTLPNDTTLYVNVYPIRNYTTGPSAKFQIIVSSNYTQNVTDKFPVPGNNGLISTQVTNKGKNGQITFYKSNGANDTYKVYSFFGDLPEGAFRFSACGAESFAQPVPIDQLEDIGGGQMRVTFSGLNPDLPTGVMIIVSRPNGYSSSYAYGILNSSGFMVKSSILTVILFALFALLF